MTPARTRGTLALLSRLAKVAYRSASAEEMGMSMRHYVVLTYLADHSGAPQGQLGETMHLEPNSLVLLLNELEADGLIERRRDPDDRRRHVVDLTDAGARAQVKAEAALESTEDRVLRGLSADERKELRGLLDRALDTAVDPAAEELPA